MGSQKMASTTPHAYHSLDQTVQELAGKIVVKRRDNESARQVQLDAIEINEDVIGSLRERVKVRRRDLAHMLNKDKEVTENALADPKHRFQRLQCKRYDADTAKQELNEDLCNEIKRMNRVKYQKECRRKRLADLLLKLHDYCLLQETNYEEVEQMELRRLKTEEDTYKRPKRPRHAPSRTKEAIGRTARLETNPTKDNNRPRSKTSKCRLASVRILGQKNCPGSTNQSNGEENAANSCRSSAGASTAWI